MPSRCTPPRPFIGLNPTRRLDRSSAFIDADPVLAQAGQPVTDRTLILHLVDSLPVRWDVAEREALIHDLAAAGSASPGVASLVAAIRRRFGRPTHRRHHQALEAAATLERTLERRASARTHLGGAPTAPRDRARPWSSAEARSFLGYAPILDRTTPIVSMGCCFSTAIAHVLHRGRARYLVTERSVVPGVELQHSSAAWGNLYHAAGIRQEIEAALLGRVPPMMHWRRGQGARSQLVDPWRDEVFHANETAMIDSWNAHLVAAREALTRAEVLVLTLTQHEVWRLRGTDHVLARKPWGMDDALFDLLIADVDEVAAELQRAIRTVRAVNPNCRFVLAVSPLRQSEAEDLSRHPIEVATEGQSIHTAAIARVAREDSGVEAFPFLTFAQARGVDAYAPDERTVARRVYSEAVDAFLERHERRPEDTAARLFESSIDDLPVAWTALGAAAGARIERGIGVSGAGALLSGTGRPPIAPLLVLCADREVDHPEVVEARLAGAHVITSEGPDLDRLLGSFRHQSRMHAVFTSLGELVPGEARPLMDELGAAWLVHHRTGHSTPRALRLLAWLEQNMPPGGRPLLVDALRELYPERDSIPPEPRTPSYRTRLAPGASESAILGERDLAAAALHAAGRAAATAHLGGAPLLARIRLLDRESVASGALDDGPWLVKVHLLLHPEGGAPILLEDGARGWPVGERPLLVLTAVLDAFGAAMPRHTTFGRWLPTHARARIAGNDRWLARWTDDAPWKDPQTTREDEA